MKKFESCFVVYGLRVKLIRVNKRRNKVIVDVCMCGMIRFIMVV